MFTNRTYLGRIAKIQTSKLRNEIMDLYEKYETACELSEGPDKLRSVHWEVKAQEQRDYLEQRLERCGV